MSIDKVTLAYDTTRRYPVDEAENRATYTVDETARILGIGRSAAYEGIRRRDIPSIRVGKRLLVPRAALEHLLSDPTKAS
jgi:excisionase family DNA binding protein